MPLYTRLYLLKKTKNEPEISTRKIEPSTMSTRTWAGPEQDVPCLNPENSNPAQVLKEHMAPVMSLAFVPAGELGTQEMLITAAGDWTVRMWQRELGVGKYRSVGKVAVDHSGWVFSMCYISKEACLSLGVPMPILVTASGDKTLKVINSLISDRVRDRLS